LTKLISVSLQIIFHNNICVISVFDSFQLIFDEWKIFGDERFYCVITLILCVLTIRYEFSELSKMHPNMLGPDGLNDYVSFRF
jgi:hypothetical protein